MLKIIEHRLVLIYWKIVKKTRHFFPCKAYVHIFKIVTSFNFIKQLLKSKIYASNSEIEFIMICFQNAMPFCYNMNAVYGGEKRLLKCFKIFFINKIYGIDFVVEVFRWNKNAYAFTFHKYPSLWIILTHIAEKSIG